MGIFIFPQFDNKKKKMSSGLEAVSGNGFVGVSLYRIRIADWVSVSIGGWSNLIGECSADHAFILINHCF